MLLSETEGNILDNPNLTSNLLELRKGNTPHNFWVCARRKAPEKHFKICDIFNILYNTLYNTLYITLLSVN